MFSGKTILITGGTGSWAQELARQLLPYKPKEIRIFSRGELQQVEMRRAFNDDRLSFYIGDVRDGERLMLSMRGVDYVFHFAALKHVPVCEYNPSEAVATNIAGTERVIEAAVANGVEKVIFAASDKGVDPINLYGITKACAERLIVAANRLSAKTKFIVVRAGNVIASRGSVVPLFRDQIKNGNLVTITHPAMTRFYIDLRVLIHFMLNVAMSGKGGEIFIPRAATVSTLDLAKAMISRLGNSRTKIKEIGVRVGEKVHEVLVSRNELGRAFDAGKYVVVLSLASSDETLAFYKKDGVVLEREYNSQDALMTKPKEILALFKDYLRDAPLRRKKEDYLSYFKHEGWTTKKINSHNGRGRATR